MDVTRQTEVKIRKLERVAHELRQGERFNITRLTSLKSLCQPWENAAAFAALLAHRVRERYEETGRPRHLAEEVWARNRRMIQHADETITRILEEPELKKSKPPHELLSRMSGVQNKTQPIPFGVMRLVDDFQLLIMEKLLRCVLAGDAEAPYWAYQAAASYAERYDPSQGTGLIWESAPLVEEIAGFLRMVYRLPPPSPSGKGKKG
jgi:hypothetical protein